MKILVANLGSTSFKYRLFDMPSPQSLARGGVDKIGSGLARVFVEAADQRQDQIANVADHAEALAVCLQQLTDPALNILRDEGDLQGVGFKAVHADGLTGVHRVTPQVLAAMAAYEDVCPAHNPPYVAAMQQMARARPDLPLVAAFETGFHATIPDARRAYAVPSAWSHLGIQRWGFHGASHRYIGERMAELLGRSDLRIISCHLGGSSSLCAMERGASEAASMGFSPQSGLPQNNRVGDFDPFALPVVMRKTGRSLEQCLSDLATEGGLLGLSGSNDLETILQRAEQGEPSAQQAAAVYVEAIRHYLGAYLYCLGGADGIVFTGGIGENAPRIREAVCAGADWCGIKLDAVKNGQARGEMAIHAPSSTVQVWTLPTNEEWIVARQTWDCLRGKTSASESDKLA